MEYDIFITHLSFGHHMRREEVLNDVRSTVMDIPGAVDMVFLEGTIKNEVVENERKAESNGAAGGLMPFRNIGVWESLGKEISLVIVFEPDMTVLTEERPVIMIDEDNQLIGEFVNEERRCQLRGRDGVHFLSDDFVLYSDLEVVGDPIFIMPTLEFRYLDDVEGVKDVTAGSISTLSDHLIRSRLGYEKTKNWTHLVGFDLRL
jgi:hypothetical protein